MKPIYILTISVAVLVSMTAQAHDPEEHRINTERPDCAALKDMDFSNVDRNDPVMQAMMKKCMNLMHVDHMDEAQTDKKQADEK